MTRSASRPASTAAANPDRSSPSTAQPCWYTMSASGSSFARASTPLGTSIPSERSGTGGLLGRHVVREGVAAHERPRVPRTRADDGDATERRPVVAEQRQRGTGVEQDDRPLGELAGE